MNVSPKSASRYFSLRILLPAALALGLFVISLYQIVIPQFEDIILGRKREMIRELTFSAWHVLDHYHAEQRAGRLSEEEAKAGAIAQVRELRELFWSDLRLPGGAGELNKNLELAGRLVDFLELGELMAIDALHRAESCGGHFREEHQTPEGEALRDDANFCHVAAWEHTGDGREPRLHREPLVFEHVKPAQRSYK
jgi:succinate dehydrogenase / fumarate reductase flavoprotein subunit